MKKIEIIVEAENAKVVLDVLDAGGITHNSVKDIEAVARVAANKPKGEGCCGGEDKKSPNLAKRAMNFAKATSEHILSGMKHVKPEIYIRRLIICETCTYRLEGFVCSKCGCYMGIKASWAEQKCMLNKW